MTYCEIADVREWIPDVTSDIVSDASVLFFINVAQGDIDDALRNRYEVPFTEVPASIDNLCARYAAYLVQRIFPDANSEEDLVRTGEELRMLLEGYQKGTLSLDDSYASAEVSNDEYFYTSEYTATYTKELLET